MQTLRSAIRDHVHGLVGGGSRSSSPPPPRTDDGLFGPRSVAWRVHGDFTSMMIGGVSALLLQMLHPSALAGVWDHSNFRRDMQGRLRRTAGFIGGTTYGSRERAEHLIARVRAVHAHVRGRLPDGTPYSADDPDLLTWVHVAEVTLFLHAFRRYRDPLMSRSEQDRYFAETSEIALRLGATDVPRSRAAAEAYLQEMRPRLRADERTREVARGLLHQPATTPALAPVRDLLMDAGVDLLPRWAADMHGLKLFPHRRAAVRAAGLGLGGVLRWSLSEDTAPKSPIRPRQA